MFRHKKQLVMVRKSSSFGLPSFVVTNMAGQCPIINIQWVWANKYQNTSLMAVSHLKNAVISQL